MHRTYGNTPPGFRFDLRNGPGTEKPKAPAKRPMTLNESKRIESRPSGHGRKPRGRMKNSCKIVTFDVAFPYLLRALRTDAALLRSITRGNSCRPLHRSKVSISQTLLKRKSDL